ncbi:MAG: hypothetical protein R3E66_08110 [bacterium]
MKKLALSLVVLLAVACGDDGDTSDNNATNNGTNNTTNNATNNASNNANNTTNNSTTSSNNSTTANNTTNNQTNNQLPDPYVAQLIYRRVATENCQLTGCIKSESVNFVSHTISNQDGRQTVMDETDGDYQALDVEAQRPTFLAALKGGFGCPEVVSPDGTTYEFEASVRENGRSNLVRADITGCVVEMDQSTATILGLFADLKAAYLP